MERIVAGQLKGPCHLVGYSLGGTLAYELACQLLAADRKVGLVALIDTPPWGCASAAPAPTRSHE